jgi:hypothetical protein
MTLGRVYVPPNRTTNLFITSRISANQTFYVNNFSKNVIGKTHAESEDFSNMHPSNDIQIQERKSDHISCDSSNCIITKSMSII